MILSLYTVSGALKCGSIFYEPQKLGLLKDKATARLIKAPQGVSIKPCNVRARLCSGNTFISVQSIELFKGEEGETGKMELKTSENHLNKFERGKIDVFHFEIGNIGTGRNKMLELVSLTRCLVTDMVIEHDNKGLGSSWCVDYVEIHFPDKALHFGKKIRNSNRCIFSSDVDRWMEKGRVDTTRLEIAYCG